MSLTVGTRLGPYEILASLGTGGMGEVYRARDKRLDRTVAIKILPQHVVDHPTRRQRFERESRAASRLSHPRICAIYDVGQQDDVYFIVMEYLPGQTLADRLKAGALPIDEAVRNAIDVADALDHAHRQGIVHRDLKPANIMLTPSGAKLLDFGLARVQASEPALSLAAQPTESLSSEGALLGTLHYMAPEQLEGREADARTDIFALGTVLYEMVAGQQPFAGASTASVIAAILNREPTPLAAALTETGKGSSSVPMLLEHVISRCLAKNPDERWQSAADLREELKWISQGSRESRVPPTRSWWRLPRPAWIGIAVVLALAAATYVIPRIEWRDRQLDSPTFTQLTFRRGNLTQARFAPDGQTIFYSAAWDGGPVQLFETRANASGARTFGPMQTGLESASPGNELAVILGCQLDGGYCTGTLARMPLSGGAPKEVLENVVNADWTPDGSELAVIHVVDGQSQLEFPIKNRLHVSTGKLQWVAFSPAGDKLAFVEHPILADESGDLKVSDREGRVTTVSAGWKTIRAPRWSPDGKEIWFAGSRHGKTCILHAVTLTGKLRVLLQAPGDLTLYDVSRDGRLLVANGPARARMIWADGDAQRDLSWLDWSTVANMSTDGQTLLFYEWGEGVNANPVVFTREVNGTEAKRLGDGKALALSPDGRWALALVEKGPQLLLLPTGPGESRPIPTAGLTDVYWARWFPDVPPRRLLIASSGADNLPRSFILDIETGQLQPFAEPGVLGTLVSPDGQRILARDPLGTYDMWPVGGGEPTHVDGILSEDHPIGWSPDGRFVYLHSEDSHSLRIHRYRFDTGRRELWRELVPRDPAGVTSIAAGRREVAITSNGRNIAYTYWMVLDALFLVSPS